MTATRYAIKSTKDDLYVFALAQHTNPAATEDVRKAKTWASVSSARRAIATFNLKSVEVVPVVLAEGSAR